MYAAGTGNDEEELLQRTRVYMPDGADVVLDLSRLAMFESRADARRFMSRLPLIEDRFRALLKAVRLASFRTRLQ